MKYGEYTLTFFDIETMGLSAINQDFVLSVFLNDDNQYVSNTIDGTISNFTKVDGKNNYNTLLVTYNGENYRGGFDFPFLRTKFMKGNRDWVFYGVRHLDIYPLVKKYFNTSLHEHQPVAKSNFRADDVKKLAKANDIEYTNKKETYSKIEQLDDIDWLEYTEQSDNTYNDLQSVYQFFFDPNKEEVYIDGADTAKLIEEGNDLEVVEHCINDVTRLKKITEMVLSYVPRYEIDRNINNL